jgi:hypothetical protein
VGGSNVVVIPAELALETLLSYELCAAMYDFSAELYEAYSISQSGFSIVQLGAG